MSIILPDEQSCRVQRVGVDHAAEALAILREAAAWTNARGIDVWTQAELRERDLVASARCAELIVGFCGSRSAATMILQSSDPIYWPAAEPNTSLYLHKVAVRREFAGRSWLTRLIEFAACEAQDRGIHLLRLDTLFGSPLQGLYARHGFAAVDQTPMIVERRPMIRMQRTLR